MDKEKFLKDFILNAIEYIRIRGYLTVEEKNELIKTGKYSKMSDSEIMDILLSEDNEFEYYFDVLDDELNYKAGIAEIDVSKEEALKAALSEGKRMKSEHYAST